MSADNRDTQLLFQCLAGPPLGHRTLTLNKAKFLEVLGGIQSEGDLRSLKAKTVTLRATINFSDNDKEGLRNIDRDGDTATLRKDVLVSELDQILDARTLERAKYYVNRLVMGWRSERIGKGHE